LPNLSFLDQSAPHHSALPRAVTRPLLPMIVLNAGPAPSQGSTCRMLAYTLEINQYAGTPKRSGCLSCVPDLVHVPTDGATTADHVGSLWDFLSDILKESFHQPRHLSIDDSSGLLEPLLSHRQTSLFSHRQFSQNDFIQSRL
jgi:hypothetical protein